MSFPGISLCQRNYSLDLLQDANLFLLKASSTPTNPSHNFTYDDAKLLNNLTQFKSLIGKLIYLTHPVLTLVFCLQARAIPFQTHKGTYESNYKDSMIHKECTGARTIFQA